MQIGSKNFSQEKFHIMGILNLTPDSFSDGGKYNQLDKALYQVERMIHDGANIIDVGGESSKPGYIPISPQEEIDRIAPTLEAIKGNFDITISLDSNKSLVVKEVSHLIDLVNDIYGLKRDENLAHVIAQNKLSCCLMHNRNEPVYQKFWKDLKSDLTESIEIALKAGITKDKIILDPGVGFAKSYEQNLTCIHRVGDLKKLEYPIMMATSNKGFIGKITEEDVKDRIIGTVSTTVAAALQGANFFRVHNVKANKQALNMVEAILNEQL